MLRDVTEAQTTPAVRQANEGAFDEYVSYCALGGLITEDDSMPHKMKLEDFCTTYGVTRMTLNRWKKQPGFAEKVDQRRAEIVPLARVTAVWNANFITCLQTKNLNAQVAAQNIFLGHFGNLVTPIQRQDVQVTVNSWSALLEQKRETVEAEIIDVPATDQS